MNTYLRLLGFAKPFEKYAIPYFFYTLIYSVFNLMNFMLIMPILNVLFDPAGGIQEVTSAPKFEFSQNYMRDELNYVLYRIFGTDYDITQVLILLAVVLVICSLISNLCRYMGQWTVEKLRINTMKKLRNTVFDNVMDLHVGFFSNERKGDIISKITSDVQVVQYCITNTLHVAFREPFLIMTYLFGMIKISWQLTIFSALYLPLVGLIIGVVVGRLRKPARNSQENFGRIVSVLDESLAGVKVIKGYNDTDYIKAKFNALNDRFSSLLRYMARRQQLASPMSEFLGITAASGLLIFGGVLVSGGTLDAAGFIAYIAIFTQITRPIRSFADAFANINQGVAAGERIFSLLDTKSEITDKPDAVELTEFKDSIEFRDVHFSYENKEVICGVSFTVHKGETVALVGPSGGGKTTLSDLIPRFYEASSGDILIDGRSIKDYTMESVRSHMGIVSQDTVLFNDTIENNIRMGRRGAEFSEIKNAARIANADGFITDMDEGYQTNIGDRGVKLSGGQRQRLSIARAVLKNPDILILDEATSALDTESEKLVQDALNSLLEGRTSIVIAHRLSTIHNADRIIVIDHGRIAEQGTHDQLMAKCGIYARLIEMQQLA